MTTHITVSNSILDRSPVTLGQGNVVVVSAGDGLDWKYIQDELEKASSRLADNTMEYVVTKDAIDYVKKKDKEGFKNIIKKYSMWFCSDVFKGIVSGGIVEIIKALLI